jgi:hypothetical protein
MRVYKLFSISILGLVGLIVAVRLFTNPGQPVEIELKSAPAPPTIGLLPSRTIPGPAGRRDGCQNSAQPLRFFYHPDPSTLADDDQDRLLLSGTVYAWDSITSLQGVLIEVWGAEAERMNDPRADYIFRGQFLTDAAGHYEFTTLKPVRPDTPYLNLRASYRDYCPLLIQLHLVAASQPGGVFTQEAPPPAVRPSKTFSAQVIVTGPVLQGSLDMVLPVPPPGP